MDDNPLFTVKLIPPRKMSLEQSLEFINDELVEVTPDAVWLRKKIL